MNQRVVKIIERLTEEYSAPRTTLQFTSPLELLIATILSAQCTDERVNRVTKLLFQKYKKAEDYASADLVEFEQIIRSTGYYRRKAKLIQGCCQKLVTDFNSRVPRTMAELLTLDLTTNIIPEKIEKDLMRIIPRHTWVAITYLLIEHGRKVCKARKPLCENCVLGKLLCPSYSVGS
jgi:endonuclease-3